jgi:flavin reductase (DIM6/NTAB) family NADH-FMN oxidoreductase RutF
VNANHALPPSAAHSPRDLRNVLGSFTTGVVVVTANDPDGQPAGLTVNSFNTVSLDPALILWSLSLKAPSLAAFRSSEYFAINILSEDQEHVGRQFATPALDKFKDIEITTGITGVPILADTTHFECRTYARYPGGDHEIYLGEIISFQDRLQAPLVFYRGSFRRLGQH